MSTLAGEHAALRETSAASDTIGDETWVFGYGSLIYKVDFPYLRRNNASILGWQRRFWQGSHDHRGTRDAPGRVVTLVPSPGTLCRGMAYLVEREVFDHLDHREKNGYERRRVQIMLAASRQTVPGLTYIADEENGAYLGPASIDELAEHISQSRGPSGSNRDYVLQLARALRELGDRDEHVQALADKLMLGDPGAAGV